MKYKNDHIKNIKREHESKFDDYRKLNRKIEKHINKKLRALPIHQLLQQLDLNYFLWDFDAVSLYPSAMSDSKNFYPKIETGYAYSKHLNDELVQNFSESKFTQGSAVLKLNYYNPKKLIVQHFPVKELVEKIEIDKMHNGYILDTLPSVDFQEIVKNGGKVVEIFEGFVYREIFKVSSFKKVIDKLFELGQKKDENKDVMQLLVKCTMDSLYGEQV